jgi:uroporphyrinogen decarboxylase
VSSFLSAAWSADTPTAPIWLMCQVGRYLPEYRKLKERYGFWRMCRTPEIAAEVTLQPVRRFPLDAAILFNDIMTPLPPMGVDIDFDPGPVIRRPVCTPRRYAGCGCRPATRSPLRRGRDSPHPPGARYR